MSKRKIKKNKLSKREDIFLRYKKAKEEIRRYAVEESAVLEEFDRRLSEVEKKVGITESYTNIHERLEDIEKRLKDV